MNDEARVCWRHVRHYLRGSGGNRIELFDAACRVAGELGATSFAGMLEMWCAEFIATHGAQ